MEKEWLLSLIRYEKGGNLSWQLQFYKINDHYEVLGKSLYFSKSVDENDARKEKDFNSPYAKKYASNGELVNAVFDAIDHWGEMVDEIEVPPKYGNFWRKEFKRRNRKFPSGESTLANPFQDYQDQELF